jgi:DNA-directed RNA polymerase subunit RPC12/RpoP
VRRPTFERHPQDERIDAEPLVFPCSRCKAPLDRDGSWLVCRSCGHRLRARSHKKGLKRRNETLTCGSCGLQFRWLEWRSRAHECSSGNPSPAVQFLQQWPGSETSRERMMQVDLLIQALHGQGALAPVFIEGSPDSIRKLLDELAADA